MVEIERGFHLLIEPGAGIVGDPHIVLFEHHVELRLHHVVGEHQPGHAVGFEFHQRFQLLARRALEIAGVVAGGEGILLAADGGDDLREQPLRILRGALEHQMFEEMREPGLARRLVGGADLVPDHVGDDRRAVVGDDDDFEPVGEGEVRDVGAAGGLGRRQPMGAPSRRPQRRQWRYVSCHAARAASLVLSARRLGQETALAPNDCGSRGLSRGRSIVFRRRGHPRRDRALLLCRIRSAS